MSPECCSTRRKPSRWLPRLQLYRQLRSEDVVPDGDVVGELPLMAPRHSRPARMVALSKTTNETSTMSHSTAPLPRSGSTPNVSSIQSGQTRVTTSNTKAALAATPSTQNRHVKCGLTVPPSTDGRQPPCHRLPSVIRGSSSAVPTRRRANLH